MEITNSRKPATAGTVNRLSNELLPGEIEAENTHTSVACLAARKLALRLGLSINVAVVLCGFAGLGGVHGN